MVLLPLWKRRSVYGKPVCKAWAPHLNAQMMVKVEHVENRDGEEGIFVGEIEKTGPGQGGFPEQYGLTIEDDDALPYDECCESVINCELIVDFIHRYTYQLQR